MLDESTKKTLTKIPLMKTKAGPRDGELWMQRLKEEYQALIQRPRMVPDQSGEKNSQFCNHCRQLIFGNNIQSGLKNYPLPHFVENNKATDNDWFRLESNNDGTRWFGKCWHFHEMLRYEFDVEFDIPVTYPTTAPEIALPELDGKTAKMYRGGKICLSDHFKPLWARNAPKFGIAQAFALGLAPWLAVEIPDLVTRGMIEPKSGESTAST